MGRCGGGPDYRGEYGARRDGGFTLIELLVAIGLLGISMSLVYTVFLSVFSVVDNVEQTIAQQQRAAVLFAQMERDIGGLYKGMSGSFRAEAEPGSNDGAPFLQFTTTSALRFDPHRPPLPLVLVGYHLQRSGNGIDYDLYRSEIPYQFAISGGGGQTPVAWQPLLVGEQIRAFRITYTDQYGDELDGWLARSSSPGERPGDELFPTAIRVEIELAPEGQGSAENTGTKPYRYLIAVQPALMVSGEMRGRE